ncbi:TPA: transcriptional regulator, partial [Listeria monocytogenes]|nr:transcriptional regulator [Listeria monocytogenes]
VAKQLPNRNYKEMTYTTQIILSTIVAFGSYSSIEKMPSFFYMDEQLEEMGFMKLVDFASEQVNDNLSIPFSEKEMELLRYSFASINYRYFLLDNLINKFNNIVPGYTDLDRNIRKIHKVNHLEPLISQLVNLKEMDSLKPFEER